MVLVAKNAFGDLFLSDESGAVFHLDIADGKMSRVSESVSEFRELSASPNGQEERFARKDELAAAAKGLMQTA